MASDKSKKKKKQSIDLAAQAGAAQEVVNRYGVMSNFEPSFFGKGKSTDFRKVKSTP